MKQLLVYTLLTLMFIMACTPKGEPLPPQTTSPPTVQPTTQINALTSSISLFEAQGNVLVGTTSKYIEFNTPDYEKAKSEGRTVLLYFFADWCPICKNEQKQTFAAFNELGDPNVVGFRVHYKDNSVSDEELALAKTYGITYQHTKIILKNGVQVQKSLESWDKKRYISQLEV